MLRILLFALLVFASPAVAQSQVLASNWSVDATVGAVSDYRYRGYSLSGEGPALQAGVTLSHASGLYADGYLSTIDEYGIGDDGDGAQLEITMTVGWAGSVEAFDIDVAVAAYEYPDGDDVNYVEFPVQVARTIGPVTTTAGFAYAPSQTALGNEDNRYGWVSFDLAPSTWPVSLAVSVGHEDGAFAPDGKADWSVGASRGVGRAVIALAWIDSDAEDGQLVGSVFVDF